MKTIHRGILGGVGILAAFFALVVVTLVFRYLPLWGTRESFFLIFYTSLLYASVAIAALGFLPWKQTAQYVGGIGLFLAVVFAASGVYYSIMFILNDGTIPIYLAIISIVGIVAQFALVGGIALVRKKLPSRGGGGGETTETMI